MNAVAPGRAGDGANLRFTRFAASEPNRECIVDPDGRVWSRGVAATLANRLSRALSLHGVGPGDTIAIMAPNCAEFLVCYLAATQIGLYVVPVNWHLAAPEVSYIIDDCRPAAVFVHGRFAAAWEKIATQSRHTPRLAVSMGTPIVGCVHMDVFIEGSNGYDVEDVAVGRMLCYTSATTGRPKGVCLPLATAGQTLQRSIEARVSAGMRIGEEIQLCLSPLYHGAPLECMVVGLHLGHLVVLADRVTPEGILQLIERYLVTVAYIVPAAFARLLLLSGSVKSRYSTSSLRKVLHTGVACSVELKRRMIDWWGPIFFEAYGAAEGSGTVASSTEWLRYPGTVGRALPGSKLLIVDDNGEPVPAGTVGTIYMTRYTGDRFEYLGDPEKTAACHRGDYFTVGDVGYINLEGYLFLSDRKIDMINVGGLKVYPAEIESLLNVLPEVADAAVIGIPDSLFGEAVVALVVPADACHDAHHLKTSIMRYLQPRLSSSKLPRHIELLESLDRDTTGKLRKRHLREIYGARIKA